MIAFSSSSWRVSPCANTDVALISTVATPGTLTFPSLVIVLLDSPSMVRLCSVWKANRLASFFPLPKAYEIIEIR